MHHPQFFHLFPLAWILCMPWNWSQLPLWFRMFLPCFCKFLPLLLCNLIFVLLQFPLFSLLSSSANDECTCGYTAATPLVFITGFFLPLFFVWVQRISSFFTFLAAPMHIQLHTTYCLFSLKVLNCMPCLETNFSPCTSMGCVAEGYFTNVTFPESIPIILSTCTQLTTPPSFIHAWVNSDHAMFHWLTGIQTNCLQSTLLEFLNCFPSYWPWIFGFVLS